MFRYNGARWHKNLVYSASENFFSYLDYVNQFVWKRICLFICLFIAVKLVCLFISILVVYVWITFDS